MVPLKFIEIHKPKVLHSHLQFIVPYKHNYIQWKEDFSLQQSNNYLFKIFYTYKCSTYEVQPKHTAFLSYYKQTAKYLKWIDATLHFVIPAYLYRFYFVEFFRNVMQMDTLPGMFFCFTSLFCFSQNNVSCMTMRLASNLAIYKKGWPWTESLAPISHVLALQACTLCPAPRINLST